MAVFDGDSVIATTAVQDVLITDNVRDIIDNEYQSIVSQFITLVDGKML